MLPTFAYQAKKSKQKNSYNNNSEINEVPPLTNTQATPINTVTGNVKKDKNVIKTIAKSFLRWCVWNETLY